MQTQETRQTQAEILAQAEILGGRYRLGHEMGCGFASVVYEAVDLNRRRLVALKVLTFPQNLSEARRADLRERFRREAQAVSALSHPNIVALYDVGETNDGRQFLAMEHLQGETLRHRLHDDTRMPLSEAAALGIQIAEALSYAHGRGVVHRDIKPDNIFLVQSSPNPKCPETTLPKLMDFGIARLLADQGLTQDGTIVGSPAYMSPEQINAQPVDPRTDQFSLAVTLAEALSGAKPFEADSIPAVMRRILHHAPDLKGVPDRAVREVLGRAMAKNPEGRYPDTAAFAQALRRAVPQAAPAPSTATQFLDPLPSRPFPLRTRIAAQIGAACLAGLALGSLAVLPRLAAHSPPPPRTQRHEISAAWHPSVMEAKVTAQKVTAQKAAAQKAAEQAEAPIIHIAESREVRRQLPQARQPQVRQPFSRTSLTQAPAPPAAPRAPRPPKAPAVPEQPAFRLAARPSPVSAPAPGVAAALPADTPPRSLHRPRPLLPDNTPEAGANVRLRLSLDENGEVTYVFLLRSCGDSALDQIALDAVGDWRYTPAVKHGHPASSTVVEDVEFAPPDSQP